MIHFYEQQAELQGSQYYLRSNPAKDRHLLPNLVLDA